MQSVLEREITELHGFFVAWFTGALAATDGAFRRVTGVIDAGFVIIGPDGRLMPRDAMLERIRTAHGARHDLRIWTENIHVRQRSDDLTLATYEEWQEDAGHVSGRLSTALFREKPGAPNGLEWLHVHETWLPAAVVAERAA